jgi:hypothetical protein
MLEIKRHDALKMGSRRTWSQPKPYLPPIQRTGKSVRAPLFRQGDFG